MNRGGFRLFGHRVVRQVFAPNRRIYLGKTRQRALFDLAELSGEEFALGMARLAQYCRHHTPDRAVSEQTDLFTFRRR